MARSLATASAETFVVDDGHVRVLGHVRIVVRGLLRGRIGAAPGHDGHFIGLGGTGDHHRRGRTGQKMHRFHC
jgi:hypothetical protein